MTDPVLATLPPAPAHASDWIAVPVLLLVVTVGVYVVAALDVLAAAVVAGERVRPGEVLRRPVAEAALLASQLRNCTERPDALLWALAPAAYGGLAVLALSVVPLAEGFAVADVRTGIVVFGAAEVLTFVAVYLHGWSANSVMPLVGGYRYLAQGFSFMLVSMFVLIGAAVPAESLSVGRIVASQAELWNVVRQPLGLPLFLVVGLGVAFWGPLNLPDGRDIAGGTSAEVAGPQRLAWAVARRCLLVTYSVTAAAVFLGGWLGPVLPGSVWLALKSLAVLVAFLAVGHLVGRVRPERFVSQAWTVLLPLSFLDLALAGVVALR